jgi:uncharacterized protein YkwD
MKIKNWLLPGKHNKYHPHLLRPIGLSVVVALLLGVNLLQNVTAAHSFQVLGIATNINSSDVISITNQQRANNGLPALSYNSKLAQAAQAKAQDMFAKNYWAHYAPDGTSPWSFITGAGYTYTTAGENLAKYFDTSAGVVNGWMNSAGHRANILNSGFLETGVAVMNGNLQGSDTTLVVAFYATANNSPAPAPAPAPATTTPTSTPKSTSKKTTSTPAPTPVAEATPTPAPVVTDTKPIETTQAKPTLNAAVPEIAPIATNKVIEQRAVSVKESRTWSQNATLFILATVFLVSVLKHTVVWRSKKSNWRHVWLRAHPAAQYGLLVVAIVASLTSSVGVIR